MAKFDAADIQDSDIYLTLPFNALTADSEAVNTVVEQTRAKWQWFNDGRRRNPAFGTLSHLPVEVRWLIWMQLSPAVISKPELAFVLWWPSSMTRWGDPEPDGGKHIPLLHKALPLVALEIDQLYLTKATLDLNVNLRCLSFWCSKLAPWQLPWVRHVSIIWYTGGEGQRWIEIFDTCQLPNLSTLVVDLEQRFSKILDSSYRVYMTKKCMGNLCKKGRKPTRIYMNHTCEHLEKLKHDSNTFQQELALLDVLSKVVIKRTPGVKIQWGEEIASCKKCHEKCKAVLAEVERIIYHIQLSEKDLQPASEPENHSLHSLYVTFHKMSFSMMIYAALPGPLQDLILALLSTWRAAPTTGLMALRRSKARFRWFNGAKKRHPGLGTLGYLPIEVRHLIYTEVIRAVEEDYAKSEGCLDHKLDIHAELFMPFQTREKRPFDTRTSHDIAVFRAVSRTVQSELHRMYLSTMVMTFCSPHDLRIRNFSTQQTDLVRKIVVDLDPRRSGSSWITFLRRNSLPNLQTVVLRLDHQRGLRSYLRRLSDHAVRQYCDGKHCKFGLDTTRKDGRRCTHVQKLLRLAERLLHDLAVYEVIAKLLAKNVPNASIQQGPRPEDCSLCYEKCEAILQHARTHEDGWLVPTLEISPTWRELEKRIPYLLGFYHDYISSPESMRREHLKYFKA
ncbi:MAG: hypothetical protein Q9207_007476 [Kuettlingeria erythrocarpa]